MQDPEQVRLVAELTNDIKEMSVEDLWKVHQAVNEIKYVANQQKYRKRGLLLTPSKTITFVGPGGAGKSSVAGNGGAASGSGSFAQVIVEPDNG